MDRALLTDVFAAAAVYHGALAEFARAMKTRGDVETAAQRVVGTSLRYRLALERAGRASRGNAALHGRLARLRARLRATLVTAAARYNAAPPTCR